MAKVIIDLKDKVTYNIRLEKSLRDAFEAACKNTDRTGSQLIRDFMRDYCKKHGQSDLFRG